MSGLKVKLKEILHSGTKKKISMAIIFKNCGTKSREKNLRISGVEGTET
jgi:hypothetical protein